MLIIAYYYYYLKLYCFIALPGKGGHTVLRVQARYSFLLHPKLCLQDLIRHWYTEAKFSASISEFKVVLNQWVLLTKISTLFVVFFLVLVFIYIYIYLLALKKRDLEIQDGNFTH